MIKHIVTNFPSFPQKEFDSTLDFLTSLPWEDPKFYKHWLAQTFHMVSHTPRLICLAASRFSVQQDHWHRTLVDHFADEDRHEYMLIENLQALGAAIEDYPTLPEASLIVQQLYHAIDHWSPFSIFGRIFFLEALACQLPSAFKERIANCYSQEQSSFIVLHFEEDIQHVENAYASIKKLGPAEQRIVGDNFVLSGIMYQAFLKAIHRHAAINDHTKKTAASVA
jgi:hypothetical protein